MMQFFIEFNWALAFRRLVWTGVYVAMFGLIVLMSQSLSDKQPVLFSIIILAAFVGSIGLVHARRSFHTGAWLTGIAALALGIGGILVHTILETSYWSSTIEQINADFQREHAVMEARDIVSGKRKERYENLAGIRTAPQIQALIAKEKLDPLWGRSKQCADATLPDSREFCRNYLDLTAEYEAAKEAGELESTVWDAATVIESSVNRNIASAAILAQKVFGGSIYDWTGIIVAIIVGFTQMLLALSLFVGYAPEKRRQKAVVIVPQEVDTAPLTLPVKAEAPAVTVDTEPTSPAPDPDGGGTSVTEPESKPDDDVQAETNVVTLREPAVSKRDEKRRKKEIIDRQNRALVSSYVDDRLDTGSPSAEIELTQKGGWRAGGTSGDEIYTDFRKWCRQNECHAVGRSHFGRFIGEFVDRACNSKGVVYGAVIVAAAAKRKAA